MDGEMLFAWDLPIYPFLGNVLLCSFMIIVCLCGFSFLDLCFDKLSL